jgi:ferric-dicitrate binding protein FerR (iron transport regulator)
MTPDSRQDPDVLGRIVRAAGRREAAPAEIRERAFLAASATLEHKLRSRQRRTIWRTAAAAAVLIAAIGIGRGIVGNGPGLPVALSDQFVGEAAYRGTGRDTWVSLTRDRKLLTGSEVRTGRGSRVGLVLAQGASLRLDELTEIRLVSGTRVEVVTGTAYVDSRAAGETIEVLTPVALTRDVGTQFEVRYQDGEQRVRVREGVVLMQLGAQEYRGEAGEQLIVSPAGNVQRATIAANDASWEWVQLVTRAPEIDNRPLSDLLTWVARETGRTIRYESVAVRSLAQTTILHGSVRNLAPLPAAQTVLATTDLDLEILADGSLLVKGRGDQLR